MGSRKRATAWAAVLVVATLVQGSSGFARAKRKVPTRGEATQPLRASDVTSESLASGLEVVHLAVPRSAVVGVALVVRSGSADEEPGARGTARLVEHLMFAGSARVPPGEHARGIAQLGGTTGATTSPDFTLFYDAVATQHLEHVLALEADRLGALLLRETALDAAHGLVADERALEERESPILGAMEASRRLLFAGDPYAPSPAVLRRAADRVDLAAVRRFFERHYRPDNVTVVVVGGLSAEDARAAVERHFGALPARASAPRQGTLIAEPARGQHAEASAAVPGLLASWRIPASAEADMLALAVAAAILSDGDDSRLSRRFAAGIPGHAGVDAASYARGSALAIGAIVDDAARLPDAERALFEEVARLAREAPSDEEVARAVARFTAILVPELETVAGLARALGEARAVRGDPGRPLATLGRVAQVTPAEVQRVVRTHLAAEHAVVVTFGPPTTGGAPR